MWQFNTPLFSYLMGQKDDQHNQKTNNGLDQQPIHHTNNPHWSCSYLPQFNQLIETASHAIFISKIDEGLSARVNVRAMEKRGHPLILVHCLADGIVQLDVFVPMLEEGTALQPIVNIIIKEGLPLIQFHELGVPGDAGEDLLGRWENLIGYSLLDCLVT